MNVESFATRLAASEAHEKQVALMKFLGQASNKLGVGKHTYVVGGAVRNWVLDVPIKDIDLVIDSISAGRDSDWFAKKLQGLIPAPTSLKTNQYGVAILTVKGDWWLDDANLQGEIIEIANARRESYGGAAGKGYKPTEVTPSTIEEDVVRREFTFNTLLWRLSEVAKGPDKAEIIDLTGCGLDDLRKGEMWCPSDPDKTFHDDPSRMLRAIKFLVKYGFKIPNEVASSIKRNAQKLKAIPHEAVSSLLANTILKDSTAATAIKEMDRLGLLDVIREMLKENKRFRNTILNWAENQKFTMLFQLLDVGFPPPAKLRFLDPDQRRRFREIALQIGEQKAEYLSSVLKQTGKLVDSDALIEEFDLRKSDRGKLTSFAREALLENPKLLYRPEDLTNAVRLRLSWV